MHSVINLMFLFHITKFSCIIFYAESEMTEYKRLSLIGHRLEALRGVRGSITEISPGPNVTFNRRDQ